MSFCSLRENSLNAVSLGRQIVLPTGVIFLPVEQANKQKFVNYCQPSQDIVSSIVTIVNHYQPMSTIVNRPLEWLLERQPNSSFHHKSHIIAKPTYNLNRQTNQQGR